MNELKITKFRWNQHSKTNKYVTIDYEIGDAIFAIVDHLPIQLYAINYFYLAFKLKRISWVQIFDGGPVLVLICIRNIILLHKRRCGKIIYHIYYFVNIEDVSSKNNWIQCDVSHVTHWKHCFEFIQVICTKRNVLSQKKKRNGDDGKMYAKDKCNVYRIFSVHCHWICV